MSELHTLGFVVYRKLFEPSEALLNELTSCINKVKTKEYNGSWRKIANKKRESPYEANRFIMAPETDGPGRFTYFLSTQRNVEQLKINLRQVVNLDQTSWQVIGSEAGCPEQSPHADCDLDEMWKPAEFSRDYNLQDADYNLSAIAAIMPGTKLIVWPRSINLILHPELAIEPIAKQTVELDVGDVIVFRCDLIHAGAAYDFDNARLHCFISSGSLNRHAFAGSHFIELLGDPRVRKCIKQ